MQIEISILLFQFKYINCTFFSLKLQQMQEAVYHSNFDIEESYFWFLARNEILTKVIQKTTNLKQGDEVVDIGCGTGGFAQVLSNKFKVACIDTEPLALEYCKKRGLTDLHNCYLKDFDYSNRNIKAAFMLDVIEHIPDDKEVVSQVYDMLPEDGYFIATVPAYQWLWSHHDVVHMHYRRYNMGNFSDLIQNAGFKIMYSSYFNTFLFPPALLKRTMDRISGKKAEGADPVDKVSPFLNTLFLKIFSAESAFIPSMSFPFGLSILVVAKKL